MSTEILRLPRPTKIELIRLRRRLAIARRLHRILRDRLTFLLQEFYVVLKKAYDTRAKLSKLLQEAYYYYYVALSLHGINYLDVTSLATAKGVGIIAGVRNVMGVPAPMIELSEVPESSAILPIEVSIIQNKRREILETLIRLAEYEKELLNLGREIARIRRIVTMLEKVLIPRILRTIMYLTMKFDEIEREEKVRSLKIKALLTQRS
ncbi:MAG: V-type ATP synthase subunit D [Ignisphaera sp.]|nr:V-type ATP synthase subunit D [Ignisphaera sp.]MCX8168241.1 V-type ATP synthase subunit D [Ignisphaera sp.]MDW8084891.1 V-type ATP synthase subunit D [Ignisphaera sp.]